MLQVFVLGFRLVDLRFELGYLLLRLLEQCLFLAYSDALIDLFSGCFLLLEQLESECLDLDLHELLALRGFSLQVLDVLLHLLDLGKVLGFVGLQL